MQKIDPELATAAVTAFIAILDGVTARELMAFTGMSLEDCESLVVIRNTLIEQSIR